MTIGPDPISKILWMSPRLGITPTLPRRARSLVAARRRSSRRLRHLQEAVEQVARVVGAGAGLGVVLDGRAGDVAQDQPLDRAVIEVEVRELGGAEVGLPAHWLVTLDRPLPSGAHDREAVVLRGDVDAPRG